MRSAVSVILSGTPPDQSMSYPDYQQTPHDHLALLVVVRHIGRQLRTKQFQRSFERVSRVTELRIIDSQGNRRPVAIRYLRSYPVENNDWGDFQTHRKALGLITIGQCHSQEELSELCRIHESLKVKYAFTLFDSRCLLFGLNTDGSVYEPSHSSDEHSLEHSPTSKDIKDGPLGLGSLNICHTSESSDSLHVASLGGPSSSLEEPSVSEDQDTTSEESTSRSESAVGVLNYATLREEGEQQTEFERGYEGQGDNDKDKTLTSGGSNLSTSLCSSKPLITPTNFKARTLFYPTMEQSQSLETDIEEFVSALFWVLESKRLDKLGLRKADRSLLLSSLCAPFEKKDFVGLDLESKNNKRRADGRLRKQLGDLSLQAGLPSESIGHYQAAVEILKSVNDWLWLGGALEGMCSASVSMLYPNMRRSPTLQRNSSLQSNEFTKFKGTTSTKSLPPGLEPNMSDLSGSIEKLPFKNCLPKSELLEKYREVVTHYCKYRQAGIIETEASIKAALVLIEQRETLHAADFLQNAVFISLQLTEEEKMQRFNALSDLYSRLGFHRKAAFFRRVAAMRCVSPSNPHPNWALCHSLLLQLLEGYKLSLNPNEASRFGYYGWPRLQIQVLQELVGTAKRKGNNALATRHMTLLLHSMLPHLTREEKREFALQLELLSKECEGVPVPLALENGLIVPPVHLSNIPYVRVFKLIAPTPHLRPEKIEERKPTDEVSPFVYTPFVPNREKIIKDASKADFSWVEGELCELQVLLENPLPIELKLNSMCLITEGVNFHVNSNAISIPADSTTFPVTLTGIPLNPGKLRILGYSTYTMGVKSNIRLKNMISMRCPHIDIDIVPALPFIEVETNKPKSEFFSSFSDSIVTSASLYVLMGESQECSVTITNSGKVSIEYIELNLDSRIDRRITEIFSWSDENLQSQLPILPGSSASFTIYIYGAGDFIGQPDLSNGDNSSISSLPISTTTIEGGPNSLPSRLGIISDKFKPKRTESSASNRSSLKNDNSFNSFTAPTPKISVLSSIKTYEAVLKIKYSGGPGHKMEYFRSCGIALNVEVAPGLLITKWDTLPGESASQVYLVLDVCNATSHEMELQYAKSKQILIEKKETCRIPVPLERCRVDNNVERGKEELACCQHIVDHVDLKWSLPHCTGKATLEGIRLTRAMVQLVIVSPIQWEICVNGESVKAEEMHFEAGEMISLDVSLRNQMRDAIKDVRLSLECFQDYMNGKYNYRLDSRLAVLGNDSVYIPKIDPGSSFQHSVSVMFFVAGLYKIDFKCDKKDTSGNIININSRLSVVGGGTDLCNENDQVVWKYNPPLDFQIN